MINLALGFETEIEGLNTYDASRLYRDHPILNFIKVKSDASLTNGCELVFPPLSFQAESTWEYLSQVYELAMSNGGRITKNCGHHVHVGLKPIAMDSEDFNRQSIELFKNRNQYFQDSTEFMQFELIKDVCFRYAKHQDFISSMLASSRRHSRYCRPIDNSLNRIESSSNIQDLKYSINGKFNAINLLNYNINGGKGTIEFRQHQGTLNSTKMRNWVSFIVNMFDYSLNFRLETINQGTRYNETLSNTMPYNTKLYRVFALCQNPNGATTREIMESVGINDARSVRRTINTIRRRLGSTQSVVTLNQEFYGHLNGTSNQQYDLNGYKIPQEIERISQGQTIVNNNNDHVLRNLDESIKQWIEERIETLQ